MKLINFGVTLVRIESDNFKSTFENLNLNNFNLIVGLNASGKSRLLKSIEFISNIISGKEKFYLDSKHFELFYELTFVDETGNSDEYKYKFSFGNGNLKEYLHRNDKIILVRDKDKAEIFNESNGYLENFSPPLGTLVLHSRRDIISFPYFEKIINWSNSVKFFRFGHIHTYSNFEVPYDFNLDHDRITDYFEKLNTENKRAIIDDLNEIGYNIVDLSIEKSSMNEKQFLLTERDIFFPIEQRLISQGMFRVISLLIFMYYSNQEGITSTIIIDDLSEGLDFYRATKLGKLMIRFTKKSGFQIIAATNDFFIMDVVDINYWTILRRNASSIKIYNIHNSKEKFEQFKLIGLNNSDLFSSNFLDDE